MTKTVKEISQMLSGRVEEVCQILLPGGKRCGGYWESGSVGGEKGKSLKVNLTGAKVGRWSDYASNDEHGDLIDLWSKTKSIPLPDAIKEVKSWLGISDPQSITPRKTYSKPKKTGLTKLSNTVFEYLTIDRKLTKETLDAFRVVESRDPQHGDMIAFPYIAPNGELVNVKHIALKRTEAGKKNVKVESGCAPSLFGWQAFKGGRSITITEGEIDAMTMHQYGFPALSIPFGAGGGNKNEWIDCEWDNLEQFETIYLCYDNDDPGRGSVDEVSKRLGVHRCKSVVLPHKDANECLQQGVFDDVIEECFSNAKTFDPPEIRAPIEFLDRVRNYFFPSEDRAASIFSPKLFKGRVAFSPGELTIWTGCNSHGKSLLIGQVMLIAAMRGQKAAIASLEMRPEQTLGRMLRQFWASPFPTIENVDKGLAWMGGKIWIYDLLGTVPTSRLMELIEFSVRRHGVHHFVIDSLMRCNVGGDDYEAQRRFLNDSTSFAKKHDCHIHLVAHPRKGEEERPIGRFSISGSGDISNQADNILSVWRNKAKERNEKTWTEADAVVLCDKQRESGWEGLVSLDFAASVSQFMPEGQDVIKFHELAFQAPEFFNEENK